MVFHAEKVPAVIGVIGSLISLLGFLRQYRIQMEALVVSVDDLETVNPSAKKKIITRRYAFAFAWQWVGMCLMFAGAYFSLKP